MDDRTEVRDADGTVRPPDASLRAGYEVRDADVPLAAGALGLLAILGLVLHVVLWGVYRNTLPEAADAGAAPPVVMPGGRPVSDRLADAGSPRLEGLQHLRADPPSYLSSRPVPGTGSPQFHPEDLRADRQERLAGYGWVDRPNGVARIPIERAMGVVADASRKQKEGRP